MKKQIFIILTAAALMIGIAVLLVFSNQKQSLLKFMREADSLEYKCMVVSPPVPIPNKTLLNNNEHVRKFLGNFKLVTKDECHCSHQDMLIFHKKDKSLMVSICDHCFDIIVKPGKPGKAGVVEHYKMQEDFYQRFKAFGVDWESQRQKTNTD